MQRQRQRQQCRWCKSRRSRSNAHDLWQLCAPASWLIRLDSDFCSNDEGATFAQLAAPDEFVSFKSPKIRGLFSGNPALKYKDPDAGPKLDEDGLPVESDEDEEEEEEEEEQPEEEGEEEVDEDGNVIPRVPPPRRLGELERLSFCVRQIDSHTALVPRGSIYMSATGVLGKNTSFPGLSIEEASKLSNYQLLRAPQEAATLASIRKAGVANHHSCLDAIVPETGATASQGKGASGSNAWALHVSEGGLVVSLRSLLFPGFEYSLEAGSNNYSGAYFGLGEKNEDLLFML